MTNTILLYVFVGLFVALTTWGFLRRPRRGPLWFGAVGAAGAAGAAAADAFWPMVMLAAIMVWGLIMGLGLVDLGWRARAGFVVVVLGSAFTVFWPTLETMSGGRIPCPHYVKERVAPRLVAGLDLRGGLRLVYTVDVDEAVKDRRDRHYDDIR